MITLNLIFIGAIAGLVSGLLGIGGGVIIVPGLMILGGLNIKNAIGTSLAIIVFSAAVGAYKHIAEGHFDMRAFLIVCFFAMITSYLGAVLAGHLPVPVLKKIFGCLLIVLGVNVLFDFTGRFSESKKPVSLEVIENN